MVMKKSIFLGVLLISSVSFCGHPTDDNRDISILAYQDLCYAEQILAEQAEHNSGYKFSLSGFSFKLEEEEYNQQIETRKRQIQALRATIKPGQTYTGHIAEMFPAHTHNFPSQQQACY